MARAGDKVLKHMAGETVVIACVTCGRDFEYTVTAAGGRLPSYCPRHSPNPTRDAERAAANGNMKRAQELLGVLPGTEAAVEAMRPQAFAVALATCGDDVKAAAAMAGYTDKSDAELEALAAEVKVKHRRLYQGELSAELELGHQAIRLILVSAVANAQSLPPAQGAQAIQRITDALSKLALSAAKPVFAEVNLSVQFDRGADASG